MVRGFCFEVGLLEKYSNHNGSLSPQVELGAEQKNIRLGQGRAQNAQERIRYIARQRWWDYA